MIHCKGKHGFRLAAYLNQLDITVTLQDGQVVPLEEYSFVDTPVFQLEHMIHDFNAVGTAELESIQDGAARL